ncbi:unnamed protein product [Camellia sinensis]
MGPTGCSVLNISDGRARTLPYLINGQGGRSLSSLVADDGICKSLVDTQGYVCEEHNVTTKDGYILSLQRIPMGKSGIKSNKPPVLLQHGIMINLHYVGHSLGTLMALAAFSQHNLVNMLRSAALLCPIAYLGQIPAQLTRAAADSFIAEDLYYWLGLHEFIPGGEAVANLVEEICNKTHSNCSNLMVALTGQTCCVNSSIIDVLLEYEPQPTATRNLIHLAQMVRHGSITMYDYGNEDDNNKHYGQPTPPVYDMASIPNDVPLFIGYGGQDDLADVKDVKKLLGTLKNHDADKLVTLYREEYAHADFVLGVNANQVVYDPLMAFFKLH